MELQREKTSKKKDQEQRQRQGKKCIWRDYESVREKGGLGWRRNRSQKEDLEGNKGKGKQRKKLQVEGGEERAGREREEGGETDRQRDRVRNGERGIGERRKAPYTIKLETLKDDFNSP